MEVPGKKLRNFCKPCEKRKSTTYTNMSCLTCEEEMCQSCFDTHVQFKVSREHKLVKSFEVPFKREETPTLDKCTKHRNEDIKFFCPEHGQVGCADCIILSHKNCRVEYILECINENKDSEESKRLEKDIEKYDTEANSLLESIKSNKGYVRDVSYKFERDVNLFRDEMISHIKHLADEMLLLRYRTTSVDMKKIDNLEEENKSLVDETSKMRETLQAEADQPYRLFITKVSYKQNIRLVQEQLKRIKEMNTVRTYTFERDCHLDHLVKSCKQLGSIQGLKQAGKEVAEKLSELYDNQWTDAFDILEHDMEEKQVIDTLLNTLMTSYATCQELSSRNFFERVQKAIELPIEGAELSNNKVVLSDQLKQEIKEFRKNRAPFVIRDVEKAVRPKLQLAKHHSKEVQEYVTACVEIAWLCVVQDPPLELDAKFTDEFDTKVFKDYTKRGEFVDFMVWPAMFLHKGGPLLSKGVAQGRCDNQSPEVPDRPIPTNTIKGGYNTQTGTYTNRHFSNQQTEQYHHRDHQSYQKPDNRNQHHYNKSKTMYAPRTNAQNDYGHRQRYPTHSTEI